MSDDRVLVAATRNRGKLAEINEILDSEGLEITGLDEFPEVGEIPEEGNTFEENALAKAGAVVEATGRPAIADDSGLEVDALGGTPGVHSARFAGPEASDAENNAKLLKMLKEVPDDERSARFVCTIALLTPEGISEVVRGECEGVILRELRGDKGFGYDPLFYHPPSGKTFAEMSAGEKNRLSHRSRALEALKDVLPRLLG